MARSIYALIDVANILEEAPHGYYDTHTFDDPQWSLRAVVNKSFFKNSRRELQFYLLCYGIAHTKLLNFDVSASIKIDNNYLTVVFKN